MSTVTLPLLTAVDKIIEHARALHPTIPEVVVVLGAPGHSKKSKIHGHFAPRAWQHSDNDTRVHEVLLSGESLQRGAEATLGTILHELTHAYCHANDITDTSNGHRYHNKKFKSVGEEFGLVLTQAKVIGWSVTELGPTTAAAYGDELEELTAALSVYRIGNSELKITKPSKKYKMTCPVCEDPVVTTKGWFERNEFKLYCQKHDEIFELIEEES